MSEPLPRMIHRALRNLLSADLAASDSSFSLLLRTSRSHPQIVAEHLDVLAAILAGKPNIDLQVFAGRQHHVLFSRVLRLVHSLGLAVPSDSPHLLTILSTTLQCLSFVQRRLDQLSSLVEAFSELSVEVCRRSIHHTRTLRGELLLLRSIRQLHPECASLGRLLTLLTGAPPTARQAGATGADDDARRSDLSYVSFGVDPRQERSPGIEAAAWEQRLREMSAEELAGHRTVDALSLLMSSPRHPERALALETLLSISEKYSASVAPTVLPQLLLCLDNPTAGIQQDALAYAPKFFPYFSREQGRQVLYKLFCLVAVGKKER